MAGKAKNVYSLILGRVPKSWAIWGASKRLAWLQKQFQRRILGGLARLMHGGRGGWTPETWGRNFRNLLKAYYVGVAGAASPLPLTHSDLGRIGALLKKQYEYARKFEQQVARMRAEGKDLAEIRKYLEARAQMYLRPGEAMAERLRIEKTGRVDDWFEWKVNPEAEHCDDCLPRDGFRARRGELPWMPGDGQSQCLSNCKCEWVYIGQAEGETGVEAGRMESALELARLLPSRLTRNVELEDAEAYFRGGDVLLKDLFMYGKLDGEAESCFNAALANLEQQYPGWFTNLGISETLLASEVVETPIGMAFVTDEFPVLLVRKDWLNLYRAQVDEIARLGGLSVAQVAEQYTPERALFGLGFEARVYKAYNMRFWTVLDEFMPGTTRTLTNLTENVLYASRRFLDLAGEADTPEFWRAMTQMKMSGAERVGHLVWAARNGDVWARNLLDACGLDITYLEQLLRLNRASEAVNGARVAAMRAALPSRREEVLKFLNTRVRKVVEEALGSDLFGVLEGKQVSWMREAEMGRAYGAYSYGGIQLNSLARYTHYSEWWRLANWDRLDIVERTWALLGGMDTPQHEFLHSLGPFTPTADKLLFGPLRVIEELWVSSWAGEITARVLEGFGFAERGALTFLRSLYGDGYRWYMTELAKVAGENGITEAQLLARLREMPLRMREVLALVRQAGVYGREGAYCVSAVVTVLRSVGIETIELKPGQVVALMDTSALRALVAGSKALASLPERGLNVQLWVGTVRAILRKAL